jgi:uncharacterized protein YdbL (DUF1318 family)
VAERDVQQEAAADQQAQMIVEDINRQRKLIYTTVTNVSYQS